VCSVTASFSAAWRSTMFVLLFAPVDACIMNSDNSSRVLVLAV
jgi:hypothetical protein